MCCCLLLCLLALPFRPLALLFRLCRCLLALPFRPLALLFRLCRCLLALPFRPLALLFCLCCRLDLLGSLFPALPGRYSSLEFLLFPLFVLVLVTLIYSLIGEPNLRKVGHIDRIVC
jgi:hypothetical protein